MEEKINLIIDTDPGVDDATAIFYALNCSNFKVHLMTAAGGNSPTENITANALHLLEVFDNADIPVAMGARTPLVRPALYPTKAQGKFGFASYKYDRKKLKHAPIEGEACDVIYEYLKKIDGKTTIAIIGPMTNIAKLLKKHPTCKKYIEQIVFIGGTKEKIYGKPYKEFNIGYDPEAADIVLKSGLKLIMVPMELGHIAYLDKQEIKRFGKANKVGKIMAKMFEKYRDFHVGKLGAAVHDTIVFYYLAHPQLVKTVPGYIDIKYYQKDNYDFGYIDTNLSQKPNATICVDLNIDLFKFELFDMLEEKFPANHPNAL